MSQSIVKNGGPQNVWIDILSTSGGRITTLTETDVSISYITDEDTVATPLTLVAGTVGTVLDSSFVHYSNGIYQLTLPNINTGTKVLVQWSGASVATGEKSFFFSALGAYDIGVAILKLRYVLNDLDSSNYTYTDARLGQLLLISACYVNDEVGAGLIIDLAGGTITPVASAELDSLFVLKAACLLAKAEAKDLANCSVKIVDGPSTIDVGGAHKAAVLDASTACEDYQKAKLEYSMRNSNGCSSITPTTYC